MVQICEEYSQSHILVNNRAGIRMNQTACPLLLFMLSKIHHDLNCILSVNIRDCTEQLVCPTQMGLGLT